MTVSLQQINNVKLGACNVAYNGIDLGLTKGGINVTISTQNKQIMVDQFGQTVVNDYIMGRSGTVKVPMAESDIHKLVAVIPGASIVIDAITPAKTVLLIPNSTGTSLFATAAPLQLHPTANASTNLSEDVTIPLASPTGNVTFDFQHQNERIYMVEFTMYPNPTTGLMLMIGDPTASASDAAITISSGTYSTTTGAVSITTATAHGLVPGSIVFVSAATGTGAFASLDGEWVAQAGTTGTTITFNAPTGLGTTTLTGGTVNHA